MPYDPVQRHQEIEKIVTKDSPKGQLRRYYRFRADRWYGGIVTADCVGCGLACRFCWVRDDVMFHPEEAGYFCEPGYVAGRLIDLAEKKGVGQLRCSGGEPTIGRRHLLQLLDSLRGKGFRFILETNGILIGHDPGYARDLATYGFLHVRVSLKGTSGAEFASLTGARAEGFELQLRALENLTGAGVSCHPAVMSSFSPRENLRGLAERLSGISQRLADELEVEELILYPHVRQRLERSGLEYHVAHSPGKVPPELI